MGRPEGNTRPLAEEMLVKGILRADDAARLAAMGVDRRGPCPTTAGGSSTGVRGARRARRSRARLKGKLSVLVDRLP